MGGLAVGTGVSGEVARFLALLAFVATGTSLELGASWVKQGSLKTKQNKPERGGTGRFQK